MRNRGARLQQWPMSVGASGMVGTGAQRRPTAMTIHIAFELGRVEISSIAFLHSHLTPKSNPKWNSTTVPKVQLQLLGLCRGCRQILCEAVQ